MSDPTPDKPKETGHDELGGEASSASNVTSLAAAAAGQDAAPSNQQLAKILPLLEQLMNNASGAAATQTKDTKDAHKFWSTQPVPDFDDPDETEGPIEPDKTPAEIRQTPYQLPAGFEWTEVDVNDDAQLTELYELLSHNYVEDEDAMFRFDYSAEFLRWALQPPGWLKSWHPGVRVTASRKLVAFISAIPADLRIYKQVPSVRAWSRRHQHLVEINFLCVHKKLRSKRLAPVLIREITRRVHQQNIFQAAYTAGMRLPRPVTTCRYFHRPLNAKKLIETGFSQLPHNSTMARTIKLYRPHETTSVPGFREMRASDAKQCHKLLAKYLERFDLAPTFTEAEFQHWFLPRENVVYTYVVANPSQGGKITDFVSFYALPSSVINNDKHKDVKAAYLFYYAHTATPLKALLDDMIVMAGKHNFDVFNCLDLMENTEILQDLKFGPGDGTLQYYLYNWRCKPMPASKMGLVLL